LGFFSLRVLLLISFDKKTEVVVVMIQNPLGLTLSNTNPTTMIAQSDQKLQNSPFT